MQHNCAYTPEPTDATGRLLPQPRSRTPQVRPGTARNSSLITCFMN